MKKYCNSACMKNLNMWKPSWFSQEE
jgi:hypothetical protein